MVTTIIEAILLLETRQHSTNIIEAILLPLTVKTRQQRVPCYV